MTPLAVVERRIARGLLRLPAGLLRVLAGPPHVRDGLTLDPYVQTILRVQRLRRRPGMQTLTPPRARAEYRRDVGILSAPARPMCSVQDRDADGVPVRVYIPDTVRGVLVYLHGGGGVIGDLDACDSPCRALAHAAACAVVSVDYRLAPEHPFPAGLEDAERAYRWAVAQATALGARPERVAVGGDSFGGSLAALLGLKLRGGDLPAPAAQLLLYPACDFTRTGGSRDLFSEGYLLDKDLIAWFRDHTLLTAEARVAASPLLAHDVGGMGPVIIITAGFDPLRDEAKDYADRLAAAGVPVNYTCAPGLVHAFISMTAAVPEAKASLHQAALCLKDKFNP